MFTELKAPEFHKFELEKVWVSHGRKEMESQEHALFNSIPILSMQHKSLGLNNQHRAYIQTILDMNFQNKTETEKKTSESLA